MEDEVKKGFEAACDLYLKYGEKDLTRNDWDELIDDAWKFRRSDYPLVVRYVVLSILEYFEGKAKAKRYAEIIQRIKEN